jgi:hypothetical protein
MRGPSRCLRHMTYAGAFVQRCGLSWAYKTERAGAPCCLEDAVSVCGKVAHLGVAVWGV